MNDKVNGVQRDSSAVEPASAPAATRSAAAVTHAEPLDFTVHRIDGKPVNLAREYAGRVVLVVNVASQCGLTPQYAELQQLHDMYADRGLAILGFPANEFGNQEPGTDEEIAAFCEDNFGVTFDMFSKIVVKGEGIAPLYAYLTSEVTNPGLAGEIRWNFEKFLIGRDGRVLARFHPRVLPKAEEMIVAIEQALDD